MNNAYFLKHLSVDPKLKVPDIDDEDIIIIIYLYQIKGAAITRIQITKKEGNQLS